MKKRTKIAILAAAAALGMAVFLWSGGTNPSVRFGGMFWMPVSDSWVPKSVTMALRAHPPTARAGKLSWRTLAPGFEIGELPVRAEGIEVDRILLARIDPARFRFAVRNSPAGDKNLQAWVKDSCAALVVNGSYYGRDGLPATPLVSDGKRLGPSNYAAKQGAFVAGASGAGLRDLAGEDWRHVFKGTDAAMVSYPLLIAADGSSRAPRGTGWLANRSFLGEDSRHRILIGTTRQSFFSLDRLAMFLKAAPLDLKLALNLDGGPVACQAVTFRGADRRTCGAWEIQVANGRPRMIPTWQLLPGNPFGTPSMPIALMVFAKDQSYGTCGR